jgi:hypothetical protein
MMMIRALHAEMLKLRRTLALRLAILMPVLMAVIQFLDFLDRSMYVLFDDEAPWVALMQRTLVFWSLLTLPLFVTLVTALLAGMEHNNGGGTHLFALPIRREAVYAAKQVAGMALIGLSCAVLAVAVVLAGWGLRLIRPGIGFQDRVPWWPFLGRCLIVYLSSWLLISLQTWVGLRWRSFVVAVSVGIAATVAGIFIVNADWGSFYPWALPGLLANDFSKGASVPWPKVLFGCLGGMAVAAIGGWEMTRHDVG